MADRKISDLTALTTPASGDFLPIVDISEAAAATKNKRITVEELMRGMPDGTAAAPGIAFENDPNTGIYSPGADQLAISTNGTSRLHITSAGLVGIGTTSPGELLELSATTDPKIRFTDIGNVEGKIGISGSTALMFEFNGSERARIDSSGRLLVGTTSARIGGIYGSAGLQVESTSFQAASISAINNQNTADGVALMLGKSRGVSLGSTTIVNSGDQVGGIYFQGADGSALRVAASIAAAVDGTPGANDMPGRLVFSTTADGAASPTERMRIKSTGTINFSSVATYANNTAALAGGLVAGDVYRKSDGTLMITY